MILEIYFFTFLFVFGLFLYGMAAYLKKINEHEMSFCKWILTLPLICITILIITRY
jgi:ABC-type dipeptide/oligopeptide/nickel transport system permease subunit